MAAIPVVILTLLPMLGLIVMLALPGSYADP